MSVIIKGFDKPSDCDYCHLQDDSYCNVLLSFINVEHGIDTRCPLVEIKDLTDEEFDSILARVLCAYEPKDEPQTDYEKGLQQFADLLFDKDKQEQFLKECKAMGIEPQTDCPWK